jgi:hypothetical protein
MAMHAGLSGGQRSFSSSWSSSSSSSTCLCLACSQQLAAICYLVEAAGASRWHRSIDARLACETMHGDGNPEGDAAPPRPATRLWEWNHRVPDDASESHAAGEVHPGREDRDPWQGFAAELDDEGVAPGCVAWPSCTTRRTTRRRSLGSLGSLGSSSHRARGLVARQIAWPSAEQVVAASSWRS